MQCAFTAMSFCSEKKHLCKPELPQRFSFLSIALYSVVPAVRSANLFPSGHVLNRNTQKSSKCRLQRSRHVARSRWPCTIGRTIRISARISFGDCYNSDLRCCLFAVKRTEKCEKVLTFSDLLLCQILCRLLLAENLLYKRKSAIRLGFRYRRGTKTTFCGTLSLRRSLGDV